MYINHIISCPFSFKWTLLLFLQLHRDVISLLELVGFLLGGFMILPIFCVQQ